MDAEEEKKIKHGLAAVASAIWIVFGWSLAGIAAVWITPLGSIVTVCATLGVGLFWLGVSVYLWKRFI